MELKEKVRRLRQIRFMKREAEQNAIANGLFDGARTNAEVLLRGFLSSTYDPEQWRIEFIEPASTKDKESRDDT